MPKDKDLEREFYELVDERLSYWIEKNPETKLAEKCSVKSGFEAIKKEIQNKIVNEYGKRLSITDVILIINQNLSNEEES